MPEAALRVGAGVALALALGAASWTARGGRSAGGPALQPAMVCALNALTDGAARVSADPRGAATMKTSVDALSDSLFRREDSPRDRATLMDLVFEQVTKEVCFCTSAHLQQDHSHHLPPMLMLRVCACAVRSISLTGAS
jgi:hypothetical protein